MTGHEQYMKMALKEAQKAMDADEIPVGAIVVLQNQVIGKGYNQTELLHDVTAHAEMIALTAACNHLGSKYLPGATLYVTVEPCLMCAGALYWSKLSQVVFGTADEKNGYSRVCKHSPFHPRTELVQNVLQTDCAKLLKDFFKNKRL